MRGKILTVESEYGWRSREENGKEPLWNLAASPPLPRVGLARATIFRQLRRLTPTSDCLHKQSLSANTKGDLTVRLVPRTFPFLCAAVGGPVTSPLGCQGLPLHTKGGISP